MSSLTRQAAQLCDALDILAVVGLVYVLVRGRRHLAASRFAVGSLLLVPLSYVALFAHLTPLAVQERYYRPVAPFLFVLAGAGLYCLVKDVKRRWVAYGILAVLLTTCVWAAVREPVRAHRRPQTEAGLWLRQYDDDYRGFVVSYYSQPVYYAGMEFFDARDTEQLFLQLMERGVEFRYIVLEARRLDQGAWPARYVAAHGWRLIYEEPVRGLRIHQNPDSAPPPAARPAGDLGGRRQHSP